LGRRDGRFFVMDDAGFDDALDVMCGRGRRANETGPMAENTVQRPLLGG